MPTREEIVTHLNHDGIVLIKVGVEYFLPSMDTPYHVEQNCYYDIHDFKGFIENANITVFKIKDGNTFIFVNDNDLILL